ncbi:hypothetical protein PR202_gb11784 [Eleusine coracana subsp. coracana]|uniref:Serpin domain-containing protein n=1 Tax=Eleusine coracana subsp. coracana TaxID=191504 RepID=A0AAV5ENC1_ELECO|nr:hypothetical protein PR202_gb11784 [Eleusine coracana subsp. coracana]
MALSKCFVSCSDSWIEKVTSGLINELLLPESVDQTTGLVLGNAHYFKGSWDQKFDAFEPKDGEFHLLDGSSVQTPFMTTTKDQYISSYHNVKVLRLPYQQGTDKRQFSMYILLLGKQNGLWALAENLSSQPEFLDRRMPKWKIPVTRFKLPKFKVSFGFKACDLLKCLGLHLAFSTEADLSELAEVGKTLCVSSMFHKCSLEVNEEGTEPVVASDIVLFCCREPTRVDFIADHFLGPH